MMKLIGLLAGVLLCVGSASVRADPAPVLLELFTSEGCSSCPPAEALMSDFARRGQVERVPVVVLAYHVDYWDRLGWKDTYSSPQWSEEQQAAVTALKGETLYTPQLVVDGRADCVGSDRKRATELIKKAAEHAKADVKVAVRAGDTPKTVSVSVDVPLPSVDGKAFVFVTESGLSKRVLNGENSGKTLNHDGIVRTMIPLSSTRSGQPFHQTVELHADASWDVSKLTVVVVVRSSTDRVVHGVGTAAWGSVQ